LPPTPGRSWAQLDYASQGGTAMGLFDIIIALVFAIIDLIMFFV
jgi:hypothetical protein